jgi:hypothetical protein
MEAWPTAMGAATATLALKAAAGAWRAIAGRIAIARARV